jgi:hypothetical protein
VRLKLGHHEIRQGNRAHTARCLRRGQGGPGSGNGDHLLVDATFELHSKAAGYAVGAKYRETLALHGTQKADEFLRGKWHDAYDVRGVGHVRAKIRAVRASLPTGEWRGQTRASTVKVADVIFDLATHVGRFEITIDQRTIAERANATRDTVSDAINRLQDCDVLTLVERGAGNTASRYRIIEPEHVVSAISGTSPPATSSNGGKYASHELFSHRGLGATAGLLLDQLDATPRSVADLAAASGFKPAQVRNALNRLARESLAYRSPTRPPTWTKGAISDDRLADLTEGYGVDGTQARRKARHRAERERQADFLAGKPVTAEAQLAAALAKHGLVELYEKVG